MPPATAAAEKKLNVQKLPTDLEAEQGVQRSRSLNSCIKTLKSDGWAKRCDEYCFRI